MASTSRFVHDLNHEYERIHTAKEDAFWTAYMGLAADTAAARADLVAKEQALKAFLADPARLAAARRELARLDDPAIAARVDPAERLALTGWIRTFEAHVIESPAARDLAAAIVAAEGELGQARGAMELGYAHPERGFERATSVKLGVLLGMDPDERVRRAAWDGLRSIEPFVLDHGFLALIRQRNELGRMLGGEDYYDATVRRVEGLAKQEIFALLDELEAKTREAGHRAMDELARARGPDAVRPWNVRFFASGELARRLDPYFPFARALGRWGRSFAALGIAYRGASLVLDLVDRRGKYENGFMHGPVPAWRDRGAWRPARIQFTANAIPGMVGSGRRATETLFHEGGHAAHFANMDMPAPCFAQEFAPSSVAFAETQSMFLDSLLGDPDWQARYACDRGGNAVPGELIELAVREEQPRAAWNLRSMLAVCYGERALYELPERDLTPDRVLAVLRDVERRMLFLDQGSPRPILSVPHLLSGESSAYYHGYVLAEMAVEQTRQFFLARDGHLVDNPRIGPDLAAHYWREGNHRTFTDFVAGLTGKALSADPLASKAGRSVDQALADAEARLQRLGDIPAFEDEVRLDARLRVAHGNETIAEGQDFAAIERDFARWIERLEQNPAG